MSGLPWEKENKEARELFSQTENCVGVLTAIISNTQEIDSVGY